VLAVNRGRGATATAARTGVPWRKSMRPLVLPGLLAVLALAAVVAAAIGAAGIPPGRIAAALGLFSGDQAFVERDRLVLWSIRLPRIALAIVVGALLAACGAVMQGLFRNPLADPALVGVSSGAALAAGAMIVVGDRYLGSLPIEALPFAAFIGALAATMLLYRIATREGRTSIAMFLLGGLALAALANAGLGLLVFLADDRQLRDINFWMLGSLSGATWPKVAAILPFLAAAGLAMPLIARGLDLLALGESEAFHAGIAVERLKRICVALVAAAAGGGGVDLGSDRIRRTYRAALVAAGNRPEPWPAAARRGAARRCVAGHRGCIRAYLGGAGRAADRDRDRGDRSAVLSLSPAAAARAPWPVSVAP
jgi:iron complex transport system permease protein